MNHIRFTAPLLGCFFVLTACIKDELPNAEADITQATVSVDKSQTFFYQAADSLIKVNYADSLITFFVHPWADLSALSPRFVLTEGATVVPANGSTHDFGRGPVTYTVTSANGRWQRRYQVAFKTPAATEGDVLRFNFEQVELEPEGKYHLWYELDAAGNKDNIWSNGNQGFALSRSTAKPDEYPTALLEAGYEGKGVKLTTCDTGFLGRLFKKPIAAGNLFIGKFDFGKAIAEPLKATQFGTRTNRIPLRFAGYYRYTPGEVYKDHAQKIVPDKTDQANIYALIYRNEDANGQPFTLDGSNVQTSSLVVGRADLGLLSATAEWTAFDIPFVYTGNIDEQALANYGYSLAIVATSSVNGALFEGALGSTLLIDQFTITTYQSASL